MKKESFPKRLACPLLGAGAGAGLVLLVLQLKFGILDVLDKPPLTYPWTTTKAPITPITTIPFVKKKLYFQTMFNLTRRDIKFVPPVKLGVYACRFPFPKVRDVHIYMKFNYHWGNGNLIRFKSLGLKIFIKDRRLCIRGHCTLYRLNRGENRVNIAIRDGKTVYLISNSRHFMKTLSFTKRSRKTFILGGRLLVIRLKVLSVTLINNSTVTRLSRNELNCRYKVKPR